MLGERVKKFLDENGIKYGYVAESIGVSISTFSAMLNGNRKITAEEYFLICEVLKVNTEYFIKPKAS